MAKENNFADNLKLLEDIVKQLEQENSNLEEAIELYEKGIRLSKECSDTLNKARQKIIDISKENGEDTDND